MCTEENVRAINSTSQKYHVSGRRNQKMAELKVRGLDQTVIDRITELAEKKGKSRESYLRDLLISISISGELKELDLRYAALVSTLGNNMKMMNDVIDRNNYLLDEVLERLDGEEK